MSAGNVRLGTRGSALARWQAEWVADRLRGELPDASIEIVPIRARGDRHPGSLSAHGGGPGHFTSDLEDALASGVVDVAVHSLKDLPIELAAGLELAAVPLRDDSRDALVSRSGEALADLPEGARVGTSSPRRASLLRSLRPDLEIVAARGNVDSRVRAVAEGRYDAVVLALAGLLRLGLEARVAESFPARSFPPAPGQGALAVQVRCDDAAVREAVARTDDVTARSTAAAERAFLAGLGGGCSLAVGAHAWLEEGTVGLVGFVGSADGRTILRAEETADSPDAVGLAAAERVLAAGAAELLG